MIYKVNNPIYFTGDFNLNVLDYNKNEKVRKFLNLTFQYGLVPIINKPTKPTRATKNTATAIDHIITNSLLHSTMNTGIIKHDVSDHFPIFLVAETENRITPEIKVKITKRLINNKTKKNFKNALQKITWEDVISYKQTDSAYKAFLSKSTFLYDNVSEKFVVTEKSKTLKILRITKLIVKSPKAIERLYDKFLKSIL